MDQHTIQLLIDSNRYNVEILPQLEQYVQYQIDKQTYHLEANLTVLKFYQFHPEKTNKNIIGKILIKTLMNVPSTDFLQCLYLISERLHSEEPIKTLMNLSNLVETGNFREFWKEAESAKEVLNTVPGFHDAIRNFIANLISITYETIEKQAFADLVNLKGSEVESFLNAKKFKFNEEGITFPIVENAQKNKKLAEQAKSADLQRILTALKV